MTIYTKKLTDPGCGRKVVTPLSPAQWALIFDGATVSLVPSIGNWQSPCRSHYWIQRNHVKWAREWSETQIASGRERDRLDLERYLSGSTVPGDPEAEPVPLTRSRLARLRRWLRGRRPDPDA